MSCLSSPSLIQKNSPLCDWNGQTATCTYKPPPQDPVFIILVALLISILTLPLLMFLHYLINEHASNYPGHRELVDVKCNENKNKNGNQNGNNNQNENQNDQNGNNEHDENGYKHGSTSSGIGFYGYGIRHKNTKKIQTVIPNVTAAEILRDSTFSSAFSIELKKGQPEGEIVDYHSINTISQMAYAGKYGSVLYCTFMVYCDSFFFITFCHIFYRLILIFSYFILSHFLTLSHIHHTHFILFFLRFCHPL